MPTCSPLQLPPPLTRAPTCQGRGGLAKATTCCIVQLPTSLSIVRQALWAQSPAQPCLFRGKDVAIDKDEWQPSYESWLAHAHSAWYADKGDDK